MKRLCALLILMAPMLGHATGEPDPRYPDFGLSALEHPELRAASGNASYFQGFEAPCFGPPYDPEPSELDWLRYYSEVVRVASGSGGVGSSSGFFHAELQPPLADAPDDFTGAYSRLGGFRTEWGGGFTVAVDVFIDFNDPLITSGVDLAYGFDVSAAANNQAGAWRRELIFHVASNASGQVLVGSSNASIFAPKPNLASGNHVVLTESDWYTFEWVFRDNGAGILAIDSNLRRGGSLVWTNTRSVASDVIATQVGGNRYLWFLFHESDTLAFDNVRLNSPIVEAGYVSTPAAGSLLNLGNVLTGSTTPTRTLDILSTGTLRLELCGCQISGPAAADFAFAGACPGLIEPGEGISLSLACTPSAAGVRNATLTIVTNDSNAGTDFSYPLQCFGDTPAAPIVPVPSGSVWSMLLLLLMLSGAGLLAIRTRTG